MTHYEFKPGMLLDVSGDRAKVLSWDPGRDRLEIEYVAAKSA